MAAPRKATATSTLTGVERRIAIASAQAWMPDAGTTFTGRLIGARKAEGGEYGAYPVATFESVVDGSFVNVHAFHTMLKEGLATLAPSMNDVVTIHYVGYMEKNDSKKKFAAGGAEKDREYYHHYVVFAGDGSEDETDEVTDFTGLFSS